MGNCLDTPEEESQTLKSSTSTTTTSSTTSSEESSPAYLAYCNKDYQTLGRLLWDYCQKNPEWRSRVNARPVSLSRYYRASVRKSGSFHLPKFWDELVTVFEKENGLPPICKGGGELLELNCQLQVV